MILMKISLLLCFLLFLPVAVLNAQKQEADSLERLLNSHTTIDTTRVNILNELAYTLVTQDMKKAKHYAEESGALADGMHYTKGKAASLWIIGLTVRKANPEIALDYFEKALVLGEKVGDKAGVPNYLLAIGSVVRARGDVKRGNECYQKALRIAREINDQRTLSKILYNIIQVLTKEGDYLEAIKQTQELIHISKENNDIRMLANAYSQLAFIHTYQGNHPVAIEYYLSSLKLNEQIGNKSGIFYNRLNLSTLQVEQKDYDTAIKTIQRAYLQSIQEGDSLHMTIALLSLGNFHMGKDPDTSLRYLRKALAVVKGNHLNYRTTILKQMASIYVSKKQFDKAQEHLKEALELSQKIKSKRSCGEVWREMGVLYSAQKQYQQAIDYTLKALELSEEVNLLSLQSECYKQLSDYYAATGAFQQAYQNRVSYQLVKDSIFNEKNVRKVAFLESTYKYDKEKQAYEMEKANHTMKIQSQRRVILFLVIVSILVLLLAFTTHWTSKLKKRVLSLEIETMNHEMEINRKAMAAATLKLMENSERDAYSIKMLENIKKNTTSEGQSDVRSLISEYKLKSHNSNWSEFEILFQKVNSSFYEKLHSQYPNLTPNEKKLCVFIKLNMSNNHISQVTFQSEEALKKARLRLRKKLELDRDTTLATFIQSL